MHPFTLERPRDVATAMMLGARGAPATEYIAGGTDMLPLLKDEVLRPERLVAVGAGVLDDRIELGRDGTLRIGAAARMTDVADHEGVGETFPLIAQALLAGDRHSTKFSPSSSASD